MSALSKILGTFGASHPFEHAGKVYRFPLIDQRCKDALAKAYFARCRETLRLMREELTEEQYGARLDRVVADYDAGRYDFPFGESMNYFWTAGLPAFLQVVLEIPREEAELLTRERLVDIQALALCVVTESFPDFRKGILRMEAAGLLGDLGEGLGTFLTLTSPPSSAIPPPS
jgi:hypothetical protein